MDSSSMLAPATNLINSSPRRDSQGMLPRRSTTAVIPNLDKLRHGAPQAANALMEYANGAPFSYAGTRAGHGGAFGWSGSWTFHGEQGDLRRDAGHLQLFRVGETVEDVNAPRFTRRTHRGRPPPIRCLCPSDCKRHRSRLDAEHNPRHMDTNGSLQRIGANARTR